MTGSRLRLAALLLIACGPACRRAEERPQGQPAAAPTGAPAIAVAEPIAREVELTWTPEPPKPTRETTPRIAAAPMEVPTMRPTFDVAEIPNFDRPRDSAPQSRREQLSQCLSFTTRSRMTISGNNRAQLIVTAHNSCPRWIPADDTLFAIESFPVGSPGAADRETGQFQTAITPNGSAETLMEIECPGGQCRYVISVR